MKNKILSFLLVALASSAYAQESANTQVAPVETEQNQIPVEEVALNDDENLDSLDENTVTAYRFATTQLDTPVNTTVITAQDIAESFSTNIADVLEKKANVRFNNNWSGGSSAMGSINMRGFAGSSNNVLVIIDGQRMNRADMGALNWQQIPLEYIDSIEVMRGSQSAMYGNNALGGVIKITTKRGSKEDTYSANFSGGSYGMYNVNGLVTGSYENWSWSADVGRMYTDGYRENGYEWTNTYNFSAANQLSDALKLSISASFSESEFGMAGALSWDEYLSDPTQVGNVYGVSCEDDYYAIDEGIYTIALSSNTDFGEGEVAFSASTRNIHSYMPSWSEDYHIYNDQLSLNFTPRYKFNIADNASVTVGLDLEYIEIDSDVSYYYYGSYADAGEIERYSIAPYIAGEMKVAEKFIFTAAARYEYTNTKGYSGLDYAWDSNVFNESTSSDGFAANIGVTYKIDKNSSVYFRFDQIYNNPLVDEIATYQGLSLYTPFNSDLKAENGQNIEVGYKYIDENWTANANVFVMILQDEIYYNGAYAQGSYDYYGETVYYDIGLNNNYDDPTLRYGFDYQIAYDSKYWGASLMGTIMQAEFLGGEYDGCDVPLVANFTNTIAVYVKPIERLRLSLALSYTSSSNLSGDYFGEYNQAPDYFLLDFGAEFKITKYATLYFGIENLLDENYITWGSADDYGYSIYSGVGRVFKVGLNLTF